jgi:DNA polymerase-3 subunit delta'
MAEAPATELSIGRIASAPWLAPARERVLQMLRTGRLAHALLLQGQPGLGKHALAEWIGRTALCESPSDGPCGECTSCRLHSANSHPDLVRVVIREDKKQILVDDVREMIAGLTLKSYRGRRKVALIDPADAMNSNGANALLKTLEEPAGEALLVLTASRPERLPATIASRCQRLKIMPPSRAVALDWLRGIDPGVEWEPRLALVAGAPLAALALARVAPIDKDMAELTAVLARGDGDVVALAERCQKAHPGERLRWIENWVTDRIRKGLTAPAADHSPGSPGLPAALRRRHIQGLYGILDETRAARAALQGPASVAMLFERLFVMLARELEVLRTARGRG